MAREERDGCLFARFNRQLTAGPDGEAVRAVDSSSLHGSRRIGERERRGGRRGGERGGGAERA